MINETRPKELTEFKLDIGDSSGLDQSVQMQILEMDVNDTICNFPSKGLNPSLTIGLHNKVLGPTDNRQ